MNKAPNIKTQFVLCVRNDDYAASLEVRKLYVAIADKSASAANLIRVIDESGEDYLYPADYFVSCPLPRQVRETLLRTRTHVRSRVRRSARVAAYTRRAGRSKR